MNTIIKLEELAKMLFAYWLTVYLGYAWWIFPAWILAPDLSMIGYLINPRVGSWCYNIVHHQALAIAIGFLGLYLSIAPVQFAGLLLFGHSAMDRALGYGLKYEDDFKHTHLGLLGKEKKIMS